MFIHVFSYWIWADDDSTERPLVDYLVEMRISPQTMATGNIEITDSSSTRRPSVRERIVNNQKKKNRLKSKLMQKKKENRVNHCKINATGKLFFRRVLQ